MPANSPRAFTGCLRLLERRCEEDDDRLLAPPSLLAPTDGTRADLPPVSVLFAAFFGCNPAQKLLGPHVLARLPAHSAAAIRGRGFSPA